jgi:hypothetical protein
VNYAVSTYRPDSKGAVYWGVRPYQHPGFSETPMDPGALTGPWPGGGGGEFPGQEPPR